MDGSIYLKHFIPRLFHTLLDFRSIIVEII